MHALRHERDRRTPVEEWMSAPRDSSIEYPGPPSIALIHEWFGSTGGSERVFLEMTSVLPQAERYVLWNDREDGDGMPRMNQSWMARTPLRNRKDLALPLMPIAWRTLSRKPFDVVVSSSHAFAHTA